jgi:hypothetical protein
MSDEGIAFILRPGARWKSTGGCRRADSKPMDSAATPAG